MVLLGHGPPPPSEPSEWDSDLNSPWIPVLCRKRVREDSTDEGAAPDPSDVSVTDPSLSPIRKMSKLDE